MSLVRLPLAAVPWIWIENRTVIVITIVAAGISDGLDGFLARLRQRDLLASPRRRIGEWLDPLCDKTFVVSVMAAAWISLSLPIAWVALVLSREILLTLSWAIRWAVPRWRGTLGASIPAALIGKAATAAQFFTLVVLFVDSSRAFAPAVVCGILGALSAGHYFRLAIALPEEKQPPGSGLSSWGAGDIRKPEEIWR